MTPRYQLSMDSEERIEDIGTPGSLDGLKAQVLTLINDHEDWIRRGAPVAELDEPYAQIEGADLVATNVSDRNDVWLWQADNDGAAWEEL